VTYASWADTVGRFVAGKIDLIPKRHLGYWCMFRGALFTVLYLLAFFGIKENIFRSTAFVIVSLGLFASSCGYLSTLAMKMGSDSETKN
jgi:hypothetical protein